MEILIIWIRRKNYCSTHQPSVSRYCEPSYYCFRVRPFFISIFLLQKYIFKSGYFCVMVHSREFSNKYFSKRRFLGNSEWIWRKNLDFLKKIDTREKYLSENFPRNDIVNFFQRNNFKKWIFFATLSLNVSIHFSFFNQADDLFTWALFAQCKFIIFTLNIFESFRKFISFLQFVI